MKQFLKIIQYGCMFAISCMGATTTTKIISLVLCLVLGASAYAEGLFYEKD